MRIGGELGAAPEVMQCQGATAYVSVNHFSRRGVIQSIELAPDRCAPAEPRKTYAKALDGVIGPEALAAIQAQIPDSGKGSRRPEPHASRA
ncbi:MAG: hypothetical protein IPQ07_17925 [Myxococcales bacterium]|nr:hypothetical protein [Myxococcales bacterium]